MTGVATYNVTPEVVGKYFHKTACFCFERQTLEAGQEVDMPLSFWVDPRIAEDPNTSGIRTITVSYSFFRTLDDAERAGALANAGPHVGPGGDATAARATRHAVTAGWPPCPPGLDPPRFSGIDAGHPEAVLSRTRHQRPQDAPWPPRHPT